ncbi:MAG: hypothetical protein R3C18_24195 [Planctomycetaceae bacterium]
MSVKPGCRLKRRESIEKKPVKEKLWQWMYCTVLEANSAPLLEIQRVLASFIQLELAVAAESPRRRIVRQDGIRISKDR